MFNLPAGEDEFLGMIQKVKNTVSASCKSKKFPRRIRIIGKTDLSAFSLVHRLVRPGVVGPAARLKWLPYCPPLRATLVARSFFNV